MKEIQSKNSASHLGEIGEIYYPSDALRPYIEYYRIWDLIPGELSELTMQDFPRTIVDILFIFDGQIRIAFEETPAFQLEPSVLVGQFDKHYRILLSGTRLQLLNIRFRPNAIYPLTDTPLRLAFNNQLPLAEIIGEEMSLLHEQLAEDPFVEQRIALLERFLIGLYQGASRHHRFEFAMALIEQHRGLVSIQELREQLQVSYKSLERWFLKYIGLPPKKFTQLTRFKHILQELDGQLHPDWMQFVSDYQFHDQAHFIKEFRQFAGVSPTVYCADRPHSSLKNGMTNNFNISGFNIKDTCPLLGRINN